MLLSKSPPEQPLYLLSAVNHLPETDVNPLRGPDSAHGKLHALALAALSKDAIHYRLQLSILLQGPTGVGKLTTARSVARELGLHLLEVVVLLSPRIPIA